MRSLLWTVCLLASGCGALRPDPADTVSVLETAPRATELPGPAEGATASVLGIRMDVVLNAWDAPRGEMLDRVVPVRVTLYNGGPVPLQVDPASFELVSTTSGHTYAAVPPTTLALPAEEPTVTIEHVLQRGLRGDVLQRDASVSGFVFFEKPPAAELGVRLQVPLVEAGTGKRVGVLGVPLVVNRP